LFTDSLRTSLVVRDPAGHYFFDVGAIEKMIGLPDLWTATYAERVERIAKAIFGAYRANMLMELLERWDTFTPIPKDLFNIQ
jgi:hypothetical protein